MKLLTKGLTQRFAKVGRQEGVPDPIVIAKFFTPSENWTWFATEYDPNTGECFGMVHGFEKELGYFSLSEMESVKGPLGLWVERDISWTEKTLSQADPSWTPPTREEVPA